MTSEGLGEMFEGDSADTCAGKFPLVSMGGRADRQACADGERRPPSALAEIFFSFSITRRTNLDFKTIIESRKAYITLTSMATRRSRICFARLS